MSLTIGISAFAGDDGRSGISRYLASLLPSLTALGEELDLDFVVFCSERELDWLPQPLPATRLAVVSSHLGRPLLNIGWHLLRLPQLAKQHRCDVLFLPAGNRRMVGACPCPVVTTVHDLSPFVLRDKYDFGRTLYVTRLLPHLLRRAQRVIAVSAATADDVTQLAGVPAGRVSVVSHGVDHERFRPRDAAACRAAVARSLGIEQPYLLYLSRIEHPAKNHVRLIEAFERLVADAALPHQLVLCGADWNGAEVVHQRADRSPLAERIHRPGFVDDAVLPSLIGGAEAMVFPSLREGFGLPLIEALACGLPVAIANREPMTSIAAGAAALFDPEDPQQIAAAIGSLLRPSRRQALIAKGLRRAADFSWAATARATASVLVGASGTRA